jgi:hypothetical protein
MRFRRTSDHELQGMLHLYREERGVTAVDMFEVVKFAIDKGMRVPPSIPGEKRLEKAFRRAARAEEAYNPKTRRPFRVNHYFTALRSGVEIGLWDTIYKIPRTNMESSLKLRRQQMVDDGYHIESDQDQWNFLNRSEKPIQLIFNLTEDIAERKASYEGDEENEAS